MPIQLDHTIVPTRHKLASARQLAELLGVPWAETSLGPFSPVFVNDGLTLDFIDTDEDFPIHHFCFRVSEAQFDAILGRIQAAGIPYRSTVTGPMNMQINTEYGGRMVYWNVPDGHQWEMLTVSYARPAPRDFLHTRLIDAPRELVFSAISHPEHLARWWGPRGFSSTFRGFDFRKGGAWRFTLHGPDGTDYPNENTFADIVPLKRVVIEHIASPHHFILTIDLADQGQRTLVTWRQAFDTPEERDRVAHVVVEANEQNLDRLADVVRDIQTTPQGKP
ncbi:MULTISPECIES: SRPBCC domain-containing protein [unclassified Variovorax]|uniref:SRPBCC domain-containing protein n=1 Tax=unclassified Variovorax TaxID=663243 RepID=UPI00210C0D9E|nr:MULTISPECIES: SRPBCC domain-containing protein [unclassified Variovorax]